MMDKLMSEAYSIESMPPHRDYEYIGMTVRNTRVYRFYKDDTGAVWYKTEYIDSSSGEVISDEEKIFGRKLKRRNHRAS